MLRQHQASLDDRKKFTALVKDLFPDQAKNVNLLLMAYNMGDYGARKAWKNGISNTSYSRTVLNLYEEYEEVLRNATSADNE